MPENVYVSIGTTAAATTQEWRINSSRITNTSVTSENKGGYSNVFIGNTRGGSTFLPEVFEFTMYMTDIGQSRFGYPSMYIKSNNQYHPTYNDGGNQLTNGVIQSDPSFDSLWVYLDNALEGTLSVRGFN
jgi:hypothetical protein